MFFPERIKSIKTLDKVLEVGPGNTPFYRSDVLLEKVFDDEKEAFLQAGGTEKKDLKKEIVYYQGDIFPFKDNEFDYVICSHVLEHIPKNDIPFFISELCRVSYNGYIEVPLYNFELLNDLTYHLSLLYIDTNNTIHFLPKEAIDLTDSAFLQLKQFLKNSGVNAKIIPLNLEIFGYGFEFKDDIHYIIHESSHSFFTKIDHEAFSYTLKLHKDINYYIKKIRLQFNKNHFLSKIYSKFKIVF